MKTIWKYQLSVNDQEQVFHIPGWGGVAHVADQADQVTVWCHVDTEKPEYLARFLITGTGTKSPTNDFVFVGSALCGDFVWHVWRNAVTEKIIE